MIETTKESDFEDKTLVCKDCGNKFIWTAGEQKFFIDKGLNNMPKRCKLCTAKFKAALREKHPTWWVKCISCGRKAEVTFEPKSDQVYCEECYKEEIEKRDKAIEEMKDK